MENDKITPRQEKFINLVLEGYTLSKAYTLAFAKKDGLKPTSIRANASILFNSEKIQTRYKELKAILDKELQERALWTREESIFELKNVLYNNKREMERYEQAYEDEVEILNKKIKDLETLQTKSNVSKKRKKELEEEIDGLKLKRIECNRRHQSSKSVNEGILTSIQNLNGMMGYDKGNDIKVQANVSFIDDVPMDDEE